MPRTITAIKVVLASPSDVASQREIARETVNELNLSLKHRGVMIELVGWEDVSPGFSTSAQAVIDMQLLDDADVIIGIFATRLGTPVGTQPSGTVHEITHMINTDNAFGAFRVQIYFIEYGIPYSRIDPTEFGRLKDFRGIIGGSGALYKDILSDTELRTNLRVNLTRCVDIFTEAASSPTTTHGVTEPVNLDGITTDFKDAAGARTASDTPNGDDEPGLLEYAGDSEQEINIASEYLRLYASELNRLTDLTTKFLETSGTAEALTINERKTVLDGFATEIITGATRIQSFCENAVEHLTIGISFQKQAISISARELDPDSHRKNIEDITDATAGALAAVAGMNQVISNTQHSFNSWPRLTKHIGRAKARMTRAMEETSRLYSDAERMLMDLIVFANKSLH